MDVTQPDYFFDLSDFEHKTLFFSGEYVWSSLEKISEYLQNCSFGKIEGKISTRAYLIDSELIKIGKGTIVEPGAYIKGPCIIGKNCVVRHGAYIRGNLIAGNDCVLGHDSEFKNSILLNKANAAHFAYVGDSILGGSVNLGAGTVCANLRLDNGSVAIRIDGKKIVTALRKLGAIIGDFSQIGCNSVLNPGTLLGKGARCFPCSSFGGFVPAKKVIR